MEIRLSSGLFCAPLQMCDTDTCVENQVVFMVFHFNLSKLSCAEF